MNHEGKQRERIQKALGQASAEAKKPVMVQWKPRQHEPPPSRTPRQQANAHPARRKKNGQFAPTN